MPSREPVLGSRDLHPQGRRGSASGHPRMNGPAPTLGKPRPPGSLRPVGAKWTLGLCTGVSFCLLASTGASFSLPSSRGGEGNRGLSSGLRTQPSCSWLNICSAQPAYVGFCHLGWRSSERSCSWTLCPLRFPGPIPTASTFTCCSQSNAEGARESRPGTGPDCIMSPG